MGCFVCPLDTAAQQGPLGGVCCCSRFYVQFPRCSRFRLTCVLHRAFEGREPVLPPCGERWRDHARGRVRKHHRNRLRKRQLGQDHHRLGRGNGSGAWLGGLGHPDPHVRGCSGAGKLVGFWRGLLRASHPAALVRSAHYKPFLTDRAICAKSARQQKQRATAPRGH